MFDDVGVSFAVCHSPTRVGQVSSMRERRLDAVSHDVRAQGIIRQENSIDRSRCTFGAERSPCCRRRRLLLSFATELAKSMNTHAIVSSTYKCFDRMTQMNVRSRQTRAFNAGKASVHHALTPVRWLFNLSLSRHR